MPDGAMLGRPGPGWAVVISNPSAEFYVAKQLLRIGYRSFLPVYQKLLRGVRIIEGRRVRTKGIGDLVSRPLFPRYLFAELWDEEWTPITRLPGVYDLIWRGEVPARLDEDLVEGIRRKVNAGDFDEYRAPALRADLATYLAAKKSVTVSVPGWNGVLARLERLDDRGRAEVLLEVALGRSGVRTNVDAASLVVVEVA